MIALSRLLCWCSWVCWHQALSMDQRVDRLLGRWGGYMKPTVCTRKWMVGILVSGWQKRTCRCLHVYKYILKLWLWWWCTVIDGLRFWFVLSIDDGFDSSRSKYQQRTAIVGSNNNNNNNRKPNFRTSNPEPTTKPEPNHSHNQWQHPLQHVRCEKENLEVSPSEAMEVLQLEEVGLHWVHCDHVAITSWHLAA